MEKRIKGKVWGKHGEFVSRNNPESADYMVDFLTWTAHRALLDAKKKAKR